MSGDRYIISDQNEIHFVTFTVMDWVDVFTRIVYKHIITDNLNFCIQGRQTRTSSGDQIINNL
jgi:putative transposase